MDAQSIVDEVSKQLNDVNQTTWTLTSLFEYIDSAQQMIVSIRPDANSVIGTMQMAVGTKQTIPAAAIRLLEVKRNMGSDGLTPGSSIDACDHDSLDLFNSDWHSASGVAAVDNFAYDEKTPKNFYVDPPSDGTGHIEISYSQSPTVITDVGNTLDLDDIYKNAIIQWCMFRAYSIEVDSRSSQNRAAVHEQSFYQMMGRKFKRDVQFSPSEEIKDANTVE
jgi:hypothetical protein